MPRMTAPPKPARRPPGAPPRPSVTQTLGEPRTLKDRPRGWKLALRRQRRRARPILYGITALGVLIAIVSVVHSTNPRANLTTMRQRFGALGGMLGLRAERVIILGRNTTPAPLLNAAIGVTSGDSLLGYSVEDARTRLLTIASVADATVERRWPATLLVSLTERHAEAVWQLHGRFVLIDKSGAVLADQDARLLAADLPLVVGPGAPVHAAELLDALTRHPDIRAHMVAAIRVSDRRWNLQLTSGANVLLPEDDQSAALDRLDALQASHKILDRRLAVIDLRLADRTTLRSGA